MKQVYLLQKYKAHHNLCYFIIVFRQNKTKSKANIELLLHTFLMISVEKCPDIIASFAFSETSIPNFCSAYLMPISISAAFSIMDGINVGR